MEEGVPHLMERSAGVYSPKNTYCRGKEEHMNFHRKSKWLSILATLALLGALLGAMLPVHTTVACSVPKPDELGPYHVGFHWVSYQMPDYGTYHARIYYPATRDGWLAPKDASSGPYPGIVVANGWLGAEWNITWLPKHLTSHGYVTICFTPPDPASHDTTQWADGFRGAVDKLNSQNNCWLSPMRGLLDTETLGAIGLSMGGSGCIEATANPNSVIDAAVSLASPGPEGVAQNIRVPIQFQVGSLDGMVDPARVLDSYKSVTQATKEYVEIRGGNHIGFIDEFFANVAKFLQMDNPADITFAEQRRVCAKYSTAWFQYHLKGLTGYRTYIFGWEALLDRYCRGVLSDWRFKIS
jgi:dienelactone hydrolase